MERRTKLRALALDRSTDLLPRGQSREQQHSTLSNIASCMALAIPAIVLRMRELAGPNLTQHTAVRLLAPVCITLLAGAAVLYWAWPAQPAWATAAWGWGLARANDVLLDDALRPANSQPEASGPVAAPENLWLNPASSYTDTALQGTGSFQWPSVGPITQGFSRWHAAIDIQEERDNPILASDSGQVIFAAWDKQGLGWAIKINHGNGFSTIYGHNSKLLVKRGQYVHKGDLVALAGSTGNSTGNHLHFMVLENGEARNPLDYLQK